MLMVARQLTLTFDEKAIRGALERHEELRMEVARALENLGSQRQNREAVARIREAGGPEAMMRRAEEEAEAAEQELEVLVRSDGAEKPGEIERLRAQQRQLEAQIAARFPKTRSEDTNERSPSPFANLSPTRGTRLRPFVVLVRPFDLVDLWNLRQIAPSAQRNSAYQDFLQDFRAGQDSVYPLLLVEPSPAAVLRAETLIRELEEMGVRTISIEPLSSAWRPSVDEALSRLGRR
jgi:hypothetical protein